MHGRPRKAAKPENAAESAAKALKIRAIQSQVLANHHNKIYTKEALDLSAQLLCKNPEYYTAWNYRKLAVQHALDVDPDSIDSVLEEELLVAKNALRENPKAYGAWHHRKWVLRKAHSFWDVELGLLDEFQRKDERNFHAWNHRRFMAALMNRSDEDELDHTRNMIENTISNYSAWHNRSFLLSNLMKKKVGNFSEKGEVLTREYEFVREALFTDEEDQSGWFYHLWLLAQTVELESPMLVSSWPAHGAEIILSRGSFSLDCSASPFSTYKFDTGTLPLILYFSQAVDGVSTSTIAVSVRSNTRNDVVWKPLSVFNSQHAQVWVAQLSFPEVELQSSEACRVEVTIGESKGIFSSSGSHYSHPFRLAFSVNVKALNSETGGRSDLENVSWMIENFHLYQPHNVESSLVVPIDRLSIKSEHETTASTWQTEIIAEEIKHFRDLLDCKIGKLTVARLLTAHDALVSSGKLVNSEEVLSLYGDLMKLDPTHFRYYKDKHSMVLLKQLTSTTESLLSHCFQYRDSATLRTGNLICLRLNKLSLSRLGSFENLLWVEMLDLSSNELQSLEGLEALQLLSYLNLSKNKLGSFTALAPLRQLKSLKVLDVSYNEIGAHSIDTTRYLCSSPVSHSVESDWDFRETEIDGVNAANYWEAILVLKGLKLTQLDVVGNAIADENFMSFLVKVLPSLKRLNGVQLN